MTSLLVYTVPANLYVMPINPTVVENSSIVLSCDCGCSIRVIRPHWFKNNQSIRYDGSGSPYTLLANGSLRINASRWTNTAGNYSCEIGAFSWRVRSKQIKLEIWCKYRFIRPQIVFCLFLGNYSHCAVYLLRTTSSA